MKPLDYPAYATIVTLPEEPRNFVNADGYRVVKWSKRVGARWDRDGRTFGVWWWELVDGEDTE